jgi:hypothetical protein
MIQLQIPEMTVSPGVTVVEVVQKSIFLLEGVSD